MARHRANMVRQAIRRFKLALAGDGHGSPIPRATGYEHGWVVNSWLSEHRYFHADGSIDEAMTYGRLID